MNSFWTQLFALLTTETGSLAYHLILAFAVGGALQLALARTDRTGLRGRRLILGLGLLLFLQLALFVVAGLAWQGLFDSRVWLPVADRAVTMFSLVIIVWLLAFPYPSRPADAASALLFLLAVALTGLGGAWWSAQVALGAETIQGSLIDLGAQISGLIIVAIGASMLLAARPPGWEMGLGMLVLLFGGHLLQLFFPALGGEYPAVVRLAQIAAFPFLLLLPQRFPGTLPVPPSVEVGIIHAGENGIRANPRPLSTFLALAGETDRERIFESAAAVVAEWMDADLCILISQPVDPEQPAFQRGYDRMEGRPLTPVVIDEQTAPELYAALQWGRTLRLGEPEAGQIAPGLAEQLRVNGLGSLMSVPVPSTGEVLDLNILLLSPYSKHLWTAEEQAALVEIARALAHFLQHSDMLAAVGEDQAGLQEQLQEAEQRIKGLEDQLEMMRQAEEQGRVKIQSLAAMVSEQEDAKGLLMRLEDENAELRKSGTAQEEPPTLEGDLKLALLEVAMLRNALGESDQKLQAALKEQEKAKDIPAIARELRQPLASVVGHSDMLLGETMGILGVNQRKSLEKIRAATERMTRLVDDLLERSNSPAVLLNISEDPLDISWIIDDAVAYSGKQMQQKGIALRLELAGKMPSVYGDPDALLRVLNRLLKQAGQASPEEGVVWLRARVEKREGLEDYLLIQVVDNGKGLSQEEVAQIFSRHNHAQAALSETELDLAGVKSVVEAHQGRIWADSSPGNGTTFSLLLPVVERPESKDPLNAGQEQQG